MEYLNNPILKDFFLPIIFTIFCALGEFCSDAAAGISNNEFKYFVWKIRSGFRNSYHYTNEANLSLDDIRSESSIVDIDQMKSFSIAEWKGLGWDLLGAALTLDVLGLITLQGEKQAWSFCLFLFQIFGTD